MTPPLSVCTQRSDRSTRGGGQKHSHSPEPVCMCVCGGVCVGGGVGLECLKIFNSLQTYGGHISFKHNL